MRLKEFRKILFVFDLFILFLLLWGLSFFVDVGRRINVLMVLGLFFGISTKYQSQGLSAVYYMDVIKTYVLASLFAAIFFIFAKKWVNMIWCMSLYMIWLAAVLLLRVTFSKLNTYPHFVMPLVNKDALTNKKLSFEFCNDPGSINLKKFDGFVFLEEFNYSEEWENFIIHCQVIDFPVLTLRDLEEKFSGQIDFQYINRYWKKNSFFLNLTYIKLKYIIDILLIVFFSPIWLLIFVVISLLILITMGRPVIFKQERLGRDNKPFIMLKFRTMINYSNEYAETEIADPRITKLGKYLRKIRFDEIPQFWNVLKGEMSLIGPRPERLNLIEKYIKITPVYLIRQLVKPGITGWAQIHQGYAVGVDENLSKLCYDIFYIKHFSFWLDLEILFKTIYIILLGSGAR